MYALDGTKEMHKLCYFSFSSASREYHVKGCGCGKMVQYENRLHGDAWKVQQRRK